MKKLFILSISALFVISMVSQALAESSSTAQTGKLALDQQVMVQMYNGTTTDITSNNIVVFDLSNASASANKTTTGSYITTNTTAGSPYIVGVTDEVIKAGTVGRVCVRGPHRVQMTAAPTAGDTISNGTTAGMGTTQTSTANKYGYVGTALVATDTTDPYYFSDTIKMWWVWVNPTVQ